MDEYQDTNHAQYRLVNILAADIVTYVSLVMTISQCTRGEEQIFEHSGLRAGLSRGQGRQAGAELPFDADYSRCGERGGANNASRKAKALWTAGDEGERIRSSLPPMSTRRQVRRLGDRAAYR